MKAQANRNYKSDDRVYTPPSLAAHIVKHFNPQPVALEPCRGKGAFYRHLPSRSLWCEIDEGKDFFDFHGRVNWIVTNPPWSLLRPFLNHSMEVAENIVFLITANHAFGSEARMRDMNRHGFAVREILLLDWPAPEYGFPKSGFALGAVHWVRGWRGRTKITDHMSPKILVGKNWRKDDGRLIVTDERKRR